MTDTKQKIIEAAERLIAEQGYAATSLRQIIGEENAVSTQADRFGQNTGFEKAADFPSRYAEVPGDLSDG